MLQSSVIGNLGADAVYNNQQGHEFISFRVAHTDRWTDQAGQQHSTTTWVDCVINGKPKVFEYLKRGTLVFCSGSTSLRVYSSKKDRCMKAGLQINVRQIELLGGNADAVPSRLYTQDGVMVEVTKFFHVDNCAELILMSQSGAQFAVDNNGWVFSIQEQAGDAQQADDAQQASDAQQADKTPHQDAAEQSDKF